jgi:DNA-directed RNA polymerase sigma subunit (sigma70/sigma32)
LVWNAGNDVGEIGEDRTYRERVRQIKEKAIRRFATVQKQITQSISGLAYV